MQFSKNTFDMFLKIRHQFSGERKKGKEKKTSSVCKSVSRFIHMLPVILGMPSSLGTGRVTIMPWAVPTHNKPWQMRRLVTCMLFGPVVQRKKKKKKKDPFHYGSQGHKTLHWAYNTMTAMFRMSEKIKSFHFLVVHPFSAYSIKILNIYNRWRTWKVPRLWWVWSVSNNIAI